MHMWVHVYGYVTELLTNGSTQKVQMQEGRGGEGATDPARLERGAPAENRRPDSAER